MFYLAKERYPRVSLIIPCRDERYYIRQTLQHILNVPAGASYEIIVVDDGSGDGCCNFLRRGKLATPEAGGTPARPAIHLLTTTGLGVARARNLGAALARAPHLVFCDAHIIVSPGWLGGLIDSLEKGMFAAVCPAITFTGPPFYTVYGGTWNESLSWVGIREQPTGLQEIPLAPSGCLAVRKDVFRNVGGFEDGFRLWGYDDAEFSLKLWLFGFRVAVHPLVRIFHVARPTPKYQLWGEHLVFNLLLMALLHFSGHRLAKTVTLAKSFPGFTPALYKQLFLKNGARRREYMRRRVFNDDWFMKRFNIPL
ncbi:MAG: glycosyltransferase [Bacillota bacterium]